MDTDKLASVFLEIKNRHELPLYIQDICDLLIADQKDLSKKQVFEILEKHQIPDSVSKISLLDLILVYIEMCLDDDQLTQEEKKNIRFLKIWLGIKGGDFSFYRKNEIGDIVIFQIKKIYRDNIVSNDEAIFKVDLQEIFDLSFDELNGYVKEEAMQSLKLGGKIEDLDCVFTPKEYFAIKSL